MCVGSPKNVECTEEERQKLKGHLNMTAKINSCLKKSSEDESSTLGFCLHKECNKRYNGACLDCFNSSI